jgi:hypothetical protein
MMARKVKKTLFLILFLFLAQNIYANEKNSIVFKTGITPYSNLNFEGEAFGIKNENSLDYNTGFVFYLEYYRKINNILDIGIGISQQLYREPRDDNAKDLGTVCFTSFYLSPKLRVYDEIYAVLHVGVDKLNHKYDSDVDTIGLYYSLGVGYEYRNFIFEFLFSRNYADSKKYIDSYAISRKNIYDTFNFNVGYKFDFNFPDIRLKRNK